MKIKKTVVINIDMEKERKRVRKVFNKGEQARLGKAYDLFEQGKFTECCAYVNKMPYNKKGEYPESEHVSMEIMKFLRDWAWNPEGATFEILEEEFKH